MNILIVESSPELGRIWQAHLERHGLSVTLVHGQSEAIAHLQAIAPDLIILDLVLNEGSALAIADYASFRHPDTQVIMTTTTGFFSDGSIFQFLSNACAVLPKKVDPDDLTAMVEHYGKQDP